MFATTLAAVLTALVATPPSIAGFSSSAHHWRDIRDDKRFIQAVPDQPSYRPEQVREIVDNILLFQRANGGWPKDYDMTAVLNDQQRQAVIDTHEREDTSFDNNNGHSQVEYLARAYVLLGRDDIRTACERGFDHLLAAELPTGCFPQRYPNAKGFHGAITFNDNVSMGVLNVLRDAAEGAPHWAWLDAARRQQAAAAVKRGIDCILKCQIRVGDDRKGWCQQHDPVTFAPTSARTFELASTCPQETTSIVRFLMREPRPTPEMIAAIEDAVAWLNRVQLTGVRVERVPAPPVTFERHSTSFDVVLKQDSSAPPLWARHYEIETDRPIFAGRDAVKRYALAEIERERRTGTAWYGGWPQKLLTDEYPRWRAAQVSAAK